MLCQFIVAFMLFCQNVFITAQSQSSCRNSNVENDEECGQLFVTMESSLSGGLPALREEIPWQAAVYTKLTMPYKQICGGSLVSTKVVISAAHCFWSETNQQLPAKDFAVALGKLYRPWNDPMDTGAQKSDIREIRIPPRFHGSITNFQDDLALLVLTTTIEINTSVLPVCLDFEHALDMKHTADGNLGKVAGWGRTDENGKPSPTLQVVDLPMVDVKRCFDTIEPAFRPAITSDKICAGRTIEGTAVCEGDNGGGLAFPESTRGNRYYLRGVISTAPRSLNENFCNIYTYATLTHIAKHEHFIRDVIKRAEANVKQDTSLKVDPNAPPIPDITSLPLSSKAGQFRPTSEIVGGRPKPLKGAKNNFKKKDKDVKSETDSSNQRTQDPEVNVTQTRPNSQDTDAKEEYTVQIVDEPVVTQTKPAKPLVYTDADEDVILTEPNIIQPRPKPQADPDAEVEYTVQTVEDPTVTQTEPNKPLIDTDTNEDDILNNTLNVTQTNPKPQAGLNAETEYTVQIVENPTVTPTNPTEADQTTEKLPVLLSISSEPFLSTDSQSKETDISIEDEPILSTGKEQIQSTDKQPDKSIEDQPIESIKIQPDIFTVNQPTQSTGNQHSQSIGNQPSQSTSNQAAQSWNKLPSYPAPTKAIHLPPSVNQPAETKVTQLPQTTENSATQSTSQVEQDIKNKPIQPVGSPPFFSTWNQPVESISNQPAESGNPSVLSIEEQSGVAPGFSGTQPVYFEQSVPDYYTTQKNPEVTIVHHKWNTQSFGYHQHQHDFHHDHYYNHHQNHDDRYHHHNPHYHQHHDWHNIHNQW